MGFTDMPEVWVLLTGLLLFLVGVGLGLVRRFAPRKLAWLTPFWLAFASVGVVVFGSAFALAFFFGRGVAFASSVLSPISLTGEFLSFGGGTYTQACVDGKCAKYCCTDRVYPDLKWKDCSEGCTGWEGHFGESTGDTCQGDMSLAAYCRADAVTTRDSSFTMDGCNSDAANGPVTCTCCVDSAEKYWWDCNPGCSSLPVFTGTPRAMPLAACQTALESDQDSYHCSQAKSEGVSDDANNDQAF